MGKPKQDEVGPNKLATAVVAGEVTFARHGTARVEPFDAVDSLMRALDRREFLYDRHGDRLRLAASGLEVAPVVLAIHQLNDGTCQTVSSVAVGHPTVITDGMFEFQHAHGRLVAAALATGFAEWIDSDLDVLVEAVTDAPDRCTTLDLVVPATADGPARVRRAFVGPVDVRFSSTTGHRPKLPSPDGPLHGPSLVIVGAPNAFGPVIDRDATVGIRLTAVRRADGSAAADCRVNGRDFDPGRAALREHVRTWPGRTPEVRKQYVVIRSV